MPCLSFERSRKTRHNYFQSKKQKKKTHIQAFRTYKQKRTNLREFYIYFLCNFVIEDNRKKHREYIDILLTKLQNRDEKISCFNGSHNPWIR